MWSKPWSEYEKQKVLELRQLGYSWSQIVEEFRKDPKCQNRSREAVRWCYRQYNQEKSAPISLSAKALEILKKKRTISVIEFADLLDVPPKRVFSVIYDLKNQGKNIEIENDRIIFSPPKEGTTLELPKTEEGYLKFGIVSDTHLGSKYQQLSALKDFYEELKHRDIHLCFHAGDWVDGKNIYKGQEYDIFLHSLKEQREYLIEHYPKIEGIKTIGIRGNHDEAWTKLVGDIIMDRVAEEREDIEIISEYQGFVEVNGFRISLHHPDGNQAYAISYKLQKLIESFTAENLPDIVVLGHFHQKEYVTIRNVECFQPGCFQAQTPYQIRKNLHPVIGGWIVEMERRRDGSIRVFAEFIKYKPLEKDY